MTWTVGPIALGKNPKSVTRKGPVSLKTVVLPKSFAFIFRMGLGVEAITVEFNLSESLATKLEELNRNGYMQPVRVVDTNKYEGYYMIKDVAVEEKGGIVLNRKTRLILVLYGTIGSHKAEYRVTCTDETNDWSM